ncbi:hypothetical protein NODU109028_17390 [Nocardioides dubius]
MQDGGHPCQPRVLGRTAVADGGQTTEHQGPAEQRRTGPRPGACPPVLYPTPPGTGDQQRRTQHDQDRGDHLRGEHPVDLATHQHRPGHHRCRRNGGAGQQHPARPAAGPLVDQQGPRPGQPDRQQGTHHQQHAEHRVQHRPVVVDGGAHHHRRRLADRERQRAADRVPIAGDHPPAQHVRAALRQLGQLGDDHLPATAQRHRERPAVGLHQLDGTSRRDRLGELEPDRLRCLLEHRARHRVGVDQRGMRVGGRRQRQREAQRQHRAQRSQRTHHEDLPGIARQCRNLDRATFRPHGDSIAPA